MPLCRKIILTSSFSFFFSFCFPFYSVREIQEILISTLHEETLMNVDPSLRQIVFVRC